MKTVTVPKKMSVTGTIHDIASQHYDRVIQFREGQEYAIVLADYYGGRGYHTTGDAWRAIKLYKKYHDYSLAIVDADGHWMTIEELYRAAGLHY